MNSESESSKHYGIKALKESIVHFVLGKGFSAASTLIVLFLIVRELPVKDFAIYTSLTAVVLIIGLISSLGIPQVLNRFLAELRTLNNNRAMYKLLIWGCLLRAVSYAIVVLALLPFVAYLSGVFKLSDWSWLVPWYFVVGFLRVTSTFMSQAMENLLWQRDSQYSLAAGGLLKLFVTLAVIYLSNLTLPYLVAIEIAGESLSLILLIAYLRSRWTHDEDRGMGDPGSLAVDRERYARFGFWCYMQNLTSVFYGSAPNRLFAAHYLPAEQVAIFGVVDRLIDFIRRYEPLTLFVGLIRPVFMSRFTTDNNFGNLVATANFIFRLNVIILILPMVLVTVAGEPLFYWITAGKYGHAVGLFLGFYVVVLLSSFRNLLDMLVKALEKNKIYLISNVVLSGSLLIALPLIKYVGLWSIVVANLAGLLVSMVIILEYLRRHDYVYTFDWDLTPVILLYGILSVVVGKLIIWIGVPVSIATAAACILYTVTIILVPPLRDTEKRSVKEFMPAKFRRIL